MLYMNFHFPACLLDTNYVLPSFTGEGMQENDKGKAGCCFIAGYKHDHGRRSLWTHNTHALEKIVKLRYRQDMTKLSHTTHLAPLILKRGKSHSQQVRLLSRISLPVIVSHKRLRRVFYMSLRHLFSRYRAVSVTQPCIKFSLFPV